MLQVRKLVLAVAAATAFSSSFTHALGLGDLAVKSSLNQPLEAEISLLEVRDLTTIEIKSQLASPEDFSKAGIDRQFFLTGLKFTPVIGANGKPFIRVTSNKPVKEPYLNFLVEVLWPNGRLLREYTLLLDPPLYRPQQVIYAAQPAVTATATATAPRAVQPVPRQVRQPQPVAQAAVTAGTALQGSEYRVQKNDTLWVIAQRTGGNASVHQTMLAIQDLNPNAFIDGNINRMKSGQVLRLPTEQDIQRRNRADAVAQVNQQNTNWKIGRTAPAPAERQLDATHRSEAGVAPAQIEKTDNLRLVADAPGQAKQAADQGLVTGLQGLEDQLASSKERLDSTMLENEEISSRLDDLNSQLEKLKRLVELKDEQLAQLQNSINAQLQPAVAEGSLETANVLAASEANAERLEQTAAPVVDTIETLDAEQDPVVAEAQPESAMDVGPESEAVETKEAVKTAEPEQATVAIQPEAETAEEKSIVDTVMGDPMLLAAAGGGAVLALLLLLMAISRSKARKEAALYDEQLSEKLTPKDIPAEAAKTDILGASSSAVVAEEDVFDEGFAFEEPVADAQFKQETTDPIAEANNYISFGRFNQAADVLHRAIEQEPQRVDLRFKLLDVCADLEDHAGFSRQVTEIGEIGGADAELEQIKARYPQMLGAEQVASIADDVSDDGFADLSLDDITLDSPAQLSSTKQLDAELDDLSALLADSELADSESTDKPEGTEFSLDLDLDLDLSEPDAPASAAALAVDGDFDAEDKDNLDLDIDSFSFDLDSVDETQKAAAEDEFSLDDLALELADTAAAETPSFDLSEEFSLAEQDKSKPADFDLQLDEVSAELESLSANLDADSLADDTLTEAGFSEFDLDDLADLEEKPVVESPAELQLNDLEDLGDIEDDFSFLSGTDETATKLDLARAYIDMGDAEGARDILDEVISEGTAAQQDEARDLISQLG